jgi:hypothetical protein
VNVIFGTMLVVFGIAMLVSFIMKHRALLADLRSEERRANEWRDRYYQLRFAEADALQRPVLVWPAPEPNVPEPFVQAPELPF